MSRWIMVFAFAVSLCSFSAGADWTVVSTSNKVEAKSKSIIRYDWTTKHDSTAYDISSCVGRVEARFDPSVSDSSTDATFEFRLLRSASDKWQRGRAHAFPGPNDGATWVPINAITSGENHILVHALTGTSGGDTARVEVQCTGADAELEITDAVDFESTCSDPNSVSSYPCVDQNGVEWWQYSSDTTPFPVSHIVANRSFEADSGTSYLSGDSGAYGFVDAGSVGFWFKKNNIPTTAGLTDTLYFDNETSAVSDMDIRCYAYDADPGAGTDWTCNIYVRMWDSSEALYKEIIYDTQLPEDEWHHLVLTYDGATAGDPIRLYIDGGEWSGPVTSTYTGGMTLSTKTSDTGTRTDGTGSVTMGASSSGPDGRMQGIFIDSAALTDEQVAQIYNSGNRLNCHAMGLDHCWTPCLDLEYVGTEFKDRGTSDTFRDANDAGTVSCVSDTPGIPSDQRKGHTTVVGFGDSRFNGGIESQSPLAFLGQDFTAYNLAVGGDRCDEMATVIASAASGLAAQGITKAIIQCGANDADEPYSDTLATVRADIQGAIDDLVAEGIDVVVTTPFPIPDSASDTPRQEMTAAYAADWVLNGFSDATVCDTYSYIMNYPDYESALYASGNVHLDHTTGDPILGAWIGANCLGTPSPF